MKTSARQRIIDLSIRANGFVTSILRSPLHWLLSPGLALITVTGRKSGRRYTIPVGFHEIDGNVVVFVGEPKGKQWWRNYREPGAIEMRLRGRPVHGTARVLPAGSAEYRACADAVFRRARFVSRIFDVQFDKQRGLTDEQTRALAENLAIVVVTPSSQR